MSESRTQKSISKRLLGWFQQDPEPMPWRGSTDPYAIWLSEVMLQQTQIRTVIPYWNNFMVRYPDPQSLADATEDEVLSDWAGLGYYSRGRNLHRAAKQIVQDHNGQFPKKPEDVRNLPGVGEYTTAAVCSIAFGEPLAVVDGNVERVICRHRALSGDSRKGETKVHIRKWAQEWIDPEQAGDHNQAVMDLGRKVCTPKNPNCSTCPISTDCLAFESGEPERWPTPRKRRATEKQRWCSAILLIGEDVLLLPGNTELLPRHSGPVLARWDKENDSPADVLEEEFMKRGLPVPQLMGHGDVYKHAITHRQLEIQPLLYRWENEVPHDSKRIPLSEPDRLPALHRKAVIAIQPFISGTSKGVDLVHDS